MKGLIYPIAGHIASKEDFCLATIVTSDGSTPRGPGTAMVIARDACIAGTIGGGILEAETIRAAQSVLAQKKSTIKHFVLHKSDFNSLDMTCGGRVEIFIQFIDATSPYNIRLIAEMNQHLEKNRPFHLITAIHAGGGQQTGEEWFLSINGDGGENPLTTENRLDPYLSNHRSYQVIESGTTRFIIQIITPGYCVYVFGGGHVGLKVYELAKFIGLRVVVIDDRLEFADPDRFPKADGIIVSSDYERLFKELPLNRCSMIVIVTRGHRFDAEVLEKSLQTDAGYIGMIGSRKKISAVYAGLKKLGFTEKDFMRVKAPIGLPIKAETPEEIAVSIIAEIIRGKAALENV
jgi:xanthine dehydrogenase accessory factor